MKTVGKWYSGLPPILMKKVKGKVFCAKTTGNNYKTGQPPCNTNQTDCGKICVDSGSTCPVTRIEIKPRTYQSGGENETKPITYQSAEENETKPKTNQSDSNEVMFKANETKPRTNQSELNQVGFGTNEILTWFSDRDRLPLSEVQLSLRRPCFFSRWQQSKGDSSIYQSQELD